MVVDYARVREGFKRWLEGRVSRGVVRDYISSLDRFLGERVISSSAEVSELMTVAGKNDKFVKAFRNLLNYLEEREEINKEFADKLRRVLKIPKRGLDLYLPSDEEVRDWYSRIKDRDDVRLAFLIIAFSGIRVAEAVKVLNEFDERLLKFERVNGSEIAYYELNWVRGFKRANAVFMPVWLAKMLRRFDVGYYALNAYAVKRGVKMKYLRKWFINKMMEFEVPESIVKYYVGHSLGKDIMALHYLDMMVQSKRYYAKVVDRLERVLFPDGRPQV